MNYRLGMSVAIAALLLFAGCPAEEQASTSSSSSTDTASTASPDTSSQSSNTAVAIESNPYAKLELATYTGEQKMLGDYMDQPLVINFFSMT